MRAQENEKKLKFANSKELETIPEEGAAKKDTTLFPQGIDKSIKAKAGNTEFQYNQRAHKKYTSHRSLVDRILKSHSEGNRFIRNEDL